MTDKQRLKLLDEAVAELKQTTRGYTPAGVHWREAMADLAKLRADLKPPTVKLIHPIPAGIHCFVGGLHRTAGDVSFAENWALDFIVAPGTPILCPEAAKVTKLSGHDPNDDTWDSQGVYGWSIHFETTSGFHYYATHLGRRAAVKVGDALELGRPVGWVGDQDFRPDHVHLGVTAPSGKASPAQTKIQAVRDAPRVSEL